MADGTLIKLHENLARQFPGTRSAAALKIHTVIGVTAGGPKSITLHAGKTAEVKTMRIGPWVKNTILLFDLATSSTSYLAVLRVTEDISSVD